MKNILKLTLLGFLFCSNTGGIDKPSYGKYEITEEVEDTEIKEGMTLITGVVKSEYLKLKKFHIGFQQEGKRKVDYKKVTPNAKGEFSLEFPAQRGVLYCSSPNKNEIEVYLRDYKEQTRVHIEFSSFERLEYREVSPISPAMKKPVVYLYSKEKTNAELRLKVNGELTFTYPEYKNGWSVSIDSNGMSHAGKTYPYLFWEGVNPELDFVSDNGKIQASIVHTDSVVQYLENTLSKLGLNAVEQTDFITFWAPQMIKHKSVAIQFITNKAYEEHIAHLDIVPKPKNTLRVYMMYQEAKEGREFEAQKINTIGFNRDGFTLVEWGGSEIVVNSNLKPLNLSSIDREPISESLTFE